MRCFAQPLDKSHSCEDTRSVWENMDKNAHGNNGWATFYRRKALLGCRPTDVCFGRH